MNRSLRTFVFDLDDTIYKERDFVESGHRAVAEHAALLTGIPSDRLLEIMRQSQNAFDGLLDYVGKYRPDIVDRAGSATCCSADVSHPHLDIQVLLDIYRNHYPDISLDADTERVLEHLKDSGANMALVTDGRSTTQRNKIKALGLGRFFDPGSIFISEETGGDKNTDIPYLAVERRFPGTLKYYIGDNMAKDFRRPNLWGWTSVMLLDRKGVNIFPQRPGSVPAIYRPAITICSLLNLLNPPISTWQQH